jgi:hypothetical protein
MVRKVFRGFGWIIAAVLLGLGFLKPAVAQDTAFYDIKIQNLSEIPDIPRPFGYKATWLAVKTTDTEAVFKALGLTQSGVSNWETGIKFAYSRGFSDNVYPIFVTPPVKGWTLVLSSFAFTADADENISKLEDTLVRLSELFEECQYFGSYRVVDYVAWYRAQNGKIVRGYSYADGVTYANFGKKSKIEAGKGYNEEDPMEIAGQWSVNPLRLDKRIRPKSDTGLAGFLVK